MSIRKREWQTAQGEAREAWQIAYTDAAGKRRTETFVSQKEAKERHAEITVELKKGAHTPKSTSLTVAEAGIKWLDALAVRDPPLERTTLEGYERLFKTHVVPFIGTVKLASLTAPMIADFEDTLRKAKRSSNTVRTTRRTLSMLLAHALRRGLVNRNVVREAGRDPEGNGRHEHVLTVGVDIPTVDEIKALIRVLAGRWRPLILTATFTGLRASELRGLRWQDVDFANSKIHVRQKADRHHRIGPPKSKAGKRTVPIRPLLRNTLREWKLQCPKGNLDLVFPNTIGHVVHQPREGWRNGATGKSSPSPDGALFDRNHTRHLRPSLS